VISAGAFGASPSMAPGSFIEIYGSNLASTARPWASSDFNGPNAPTSLDGTSVCVGGVPAYVAFISPSQVNVQVPSAAPIGSTMLVVTNSNGASDPHPVTVNITNPGLWAPAPFKVFGRQYVVALFPDGVTYALPPSTVPGVPSRRAKPGGTLTFYGIGFGPVGPDSPAGRIVAQSDGLLTSLHVIFSGLYEGQVLYARLAPGLVGLYQSNVVVPNTFASDTTQINFSLGSYSGPQPTLYLAVGN
jgi:uncharacterized protein (TIGR03437 family)